MSEHSTPARQRLGPLDAVSFGLIVVLGILRLPQAFDGDQALFTVGAAKLAKGALYYRDFWDIKQPGIYWFYRAGGQLFGFGRVGIHLFELLWLLALAALVRWWVPRFISSPVLVSAAPFFVSGWYLVSARPTDRTVVEMVVALPLMVVLVAVTRALDRPTKATMLGLVAGVAVAATALLKLVLMPVGALFIVIVAVVLWRRGERAPAQRLVGAGALAAAVPVAALVGYYAAHHQVRQLVDATFVFPPKVTRLPGMHSFGLLRTTGRWTAVDFVLFLVPALWALWLVMRGPRPRQLAIEVWLLGTWVAVGTLLSLSQKWNPYQRLNALTPLAVLGLWGVDRLAADRPLSHRGLRPLFAIVVVAALPALAVFGHDMLRLAQNRFALTAAGSRAYVEGADEANRGVAAERGSLPVAKVGHETWYVLGDPIWYVSLGVDQGLPINGWSPEQFVPAQWDRLRDELVRFHPDRVLVDDFSYQTIVDRDPKTLELLQSRYDLAGKTSGGTFQAVREFVLHSGS